MEEIVNKIKEQLNVDNGDFTNMLVFSNPMSKKYCMEFLYNKINKDGTKQKKISTIKIAISHNPFTGEKL